MTPPIGDIKLMQGYADNEGIHLEWMQDDYDTLAGYNVYRSDKEDGNYVRINKTIIPSEENTYVDYDVEPGKRYYYTFTVVLTDVSSESKPAGKIEITAKDTMAPDVYHSPVYTATTGNKIIVSATVSDNIGIASAKLYYRVKGEEGWKSADMTATNDKYTAAIPASSVTMSGVEYYIAAYDGVSYTYAGGRTNENPYEVTVYQAVENNAKGDVDGDGNITVLDALKLLRAIYDESLLTQEEFLRADIDGNGTLSAVEALRILQYANKSISSVLW
ncbi:MAG: dockerin type I repeat-containing protein [Clostridia bacterium]|nr:dockerin type I repeat-containing protein [Clostridia bacterium]